MGAARCSAALKEIAVHLYETPHFGPSDAESHRILAAAACAPGIAGNQEPITRHIQRIERHSEQFALPIVDLRVDQHPASLHRVPVLTDPVVDVLARREIIGESAARSRRYAFLAHERYEQGCEVATDADYASFRNAWADDRLAVEARCPRKHRNRAMELLLG
jgi:hypothetical protein